MLALRKFALIPKPAYLFSSEKKKVVLFPGNGIGP